MDRLGQMHEGMNSFPNSPSELLHQAATEHAREIFEDFDEFTPAMREQARMLMRIALSEELSDLTFRDLMAVLLIFWRDCNQDRFMASRNDPTETETMLRSVQTDQFINQAILSLNGMYFLRDKFGVVEPDGS